MSNQENISKETKKTRRKKSQRKSQQIKLAVIMIMVSVLVLSASTFAWYQLNNTAKVTNMKFTADTLGNLLIASISKGENGSEVIGDYDNTLDLETETDGKMLLPATTDNGKDFYSPNYIEGGKKVATVTKLDQDSENSNFGDYVYKKEFYIKSGDGSAADKWYTLKLADGVWSTDDNRFLDGTYIEPDTTSEYAAINAVRIGFVLGDGALNDSSDTADGKKGTVYVWEPYNTANKEVGASATIDNSIKENYGPEVYKDKVQLITQAEAGALTGSTLCTIREGVPVRITMYVWFEGYDDDCVNEIALDQIAGQIQFVAE